MGCKLIKSQQINSDFLLRFMSAAIAIPVVIFLIFKGKIYLEILVLLGLTGLLREWSRLSIGKTYHFLSIVGLISNILSVYNTNYSLWIFGFFIILSLGWGGMRYSNKKIFYVLGNFYIIYAMWQLLNLNNKLMLWILFLVWFCDTGAYIFGKLIKGPKLAVKISPNKTWAGFLGGTILSFTGSIYLAGPLGIKFSTNIQLITLFLIILSHMGDLLESWSKRKFGVKDAGTILPGHGGLLDRLDSLLAVAIGLGVLRMIGAIS